MTQTTLRRTRFLALSAALFVATSLGPGVPATTRLGVSEVAGHPTVTAADTITSVPVLAGVAAPGRVSDAP